MKTTTLSIRLSNEQRREIDRLMRRRKKLFKDLGAKPSKADTIRWVIDAGLAAVCNEVPR